MHDELQDSEMTFRIVKMQSFPELRVGFNVVYEGFEK